MSVYPSKVDWWLAAILVIAPLVSIGIGIYTLSVSRPVGMITIASGIFIGILIVLLVVPCEYTITDSELLIRCGIIHQRVPLHNIVSVATSSNPLSAPALSLQRVKITLRKGFLLVSPQDREKFIREIESKITQD